MSMQLAGILSEKIDRKDDVEKLEIMMNLIKTTRNYIIIESIMKKKELIPIKPLNKESVCSSCLRMNVLLCHGVKMDDDEYKRKEKIEELTDELVQCMKEMVEMCFRNKEKVNELLKSLEDYYLQIWDQHDNRED